jgi:hypothetical protein
MAVGTTASGSSSSASSTNGAQSVDSGNDAIKLEAAADSGQINGRLECENDSDYATAISELEGTIPGLSQLAKSRIVEDAMIRQWLQELQVELAGKSKMTDLKSSVIL